MHDWVARSNLPLPSLLAITPSASSFDPGSASAAPGVSKAWADVHRIVSHSGSLPRMSREHSDANDADCSRCGALPDGTCRLEKGGIEPISYSGAQTPGSRLDLKQSLQNARGKYDDLSVQLREGARKVDMTRDASRRRVRELDSKRRSADSMAEQERQKVERFGLRLREGDAEVRRLDNDRGRLQRDLACERIRLENRIADERELTKSLEDQLCRVTPAQSATSMSGHCIASQPGSRFASPQRSACIVAEETPPRNRLREPASWIRGPSSSNLHDLELLVSHAETDTKHAQDDCDALEETLHVVREKLSDLCSRSQATEQHLSMRETAHLDLSAELEPRQPLFISAGCALASCGRALDDMFSMFEAVKPRERECEEMLLEQEVATDEAQAMLLERDSRLGSLEAELTHVDTSDYDSLDAEVLDSEEQAARLEEEIEVGTCELEASEDGVRILAQQLEVQHAEVEEVEESLQQAGDVSSNRQRILEDLLLQQRGDVQRIRELQSQLMLRDRQLACLPCDQEAVKSLQAAVTESNLELQRSSHAEAQIQQPARREMNIMRHRVSQTEKQEECLICGLRESRRAFDESLAERLREASSQDNELLLLFGPSGGAGEQVDVVQRVTSAIVVLQKKHEALLHENHRSQTEDRNTGISPAAHGISIESVPAFSVARQAGSDPTRARLAQEVVDLRRALKLRKESYDVLRKDADDVRRANAAREALLSEARDQGSLCWAHARRNPCDQRKLDKGKGASCTTSCSRPSDDSRDPTVIGCHPCAFHDGYDTLMISAHGVQPPPGDRAARVGEIASNPVDPGDASSEIAPALAKLQMAKDLYDLALEQERRLAYEMANGSSS